MEFLQLKGGCRRELQAATMDCRLENFKLTCCSYGKGYHTDNVRLIERAIWTCSIFTFSETIKSCCRVCNLSNPCKYVESFNLNLWSQVKSYNVSDIPITDRSQCTSDYWVGTIPWFVAVGAPHCTLHRNTDLYQRSPPFQACQHYVPYATLYIVTGRAPQHASSPSQTWSHRGAC